MEFELISQFLTVELLCGERKEVVQQLHAGNVQGL
jgi:hypothetical protein